MRQGALQEMECWEGETGLATSGDPVHGMLDLGGGLVGCCWLTGLLLVLIDAARSCRVIRPVRPPTPFNRIPYIASLLGLITTS